MEILKSINIKKMEKQIKLVLDSVEDEVKLIGVYPSDVEKYLKSFGTLDREIDTNGWQYDFWLYYTLNDTNYLLTGSGFYGDLKFSINEE